jgi:cytochrome c
MSPAVSRAISKLIFGLALVLSAALVLLAALSAQDAPKTAPTPVAAYAAIPVPEVKRANPVKSTPESLTRAKRWWALDCAMCHGAAGDGKGSLATDMK